MYGCSYVVDQVYWIQDYRLLGSDAMQFGRQFASIFRVDAGDCWFLQNDGTYLPNYTTVISKKNIIITTVRRTLLHGVNNSYSFIFHHTF
jgi:hypothetical protein